MSASTSSVIWIFAPEFHGVLRKICDKQQRAIKRSGAKKEDRAGGQPRLTGDVDEGEPLHGRSAEVCGQQLLIGGEGKRIATLLPARHAAAPCAAHRGPSGCRGGGGAPGEGNRGCGGYMPPKGRSSTV